MPTHRRAPSPGKGATPDSERVKYYALQAWTEGHYARDCGRPLSANPYESDAAAAEKWADGWTSRDRLSPPPTRR